MSTNIVARVPEDIAGDIVFFAQQEQVDKSTEIRTLLAQAMQEKIKAMPPEELRNFQKQQCVFCHIVAEKVPSKKIYEDEKVLAILDINPANPGHLLLLPKEHYVIMPQMPQEEISHISMVAKALSNAVLKTLKAKGTNIFIANGITAGQRAQHFMMHIIPRSENDGLMLSIQKKAIKKDWASKDGQCPHVNPILGPNSFK